MSSLISSFTRSHPHPQPQQQQSLYPQLPQQGYPYNPNTPSNQNAGPSYQPQYQQNQLQPYQQNQNQNHVQQYQNPNQNQGPSQNQLQQSNQNQSQNQNQNQVQGYGYQRPPPTSLAPQPLEQVSKDEDPIYGPLSRAKGKIHRALVGDEEISWDLEEGLRNGLNPQQSGRLPDPYTQLPGNADAFQPFRLTRSIPTPDALLQEISNKEQTARVGLFEEIERAWFTVERKLFLWDYNDGRDFSRYDERDDTIQSVGLVKARRDVFVDDITHVLIITTMSKVTLLGLLRSPNSRELSLYQTNLQADLPTQMLSISGTASGRVFMNGADKNLYELEYTSEGGWFFGSGARVSIINRSSGGMGIWMPSFLASSNKEGVEKFVIDSPQNRLYTLHTKGEIEWFDVSGTKFESRGKYTRLRFELIQRQWAGPPPHHGADVVSISVVGLHESSRIGVVVTTANGCRVYLTTTGYPPFQPIFRPAPADVFNQNRNPLSSQTTYSSGTFIGVQVDNSGPTAATRLIVTVPHSGRQSALRENHENYDPPILQEWIVSAQIPSQVWTVVEIPSGDPANAPFSLRLGSGRGLSELPRQATAEARQFLILATSGLYWATLPRPIDILQADLKIEKDNAIANVRMTWGAIQVAAMGTLLGSTADLQEPEIASTVNTIVNLSASPVVKDSTAGKNITYSTRHDGLALTLARYLRPIWLQNVTIPVMGGRQVLGVGESRLLEVQGRLERLRRYVEEHPFPRNQAEGDLKLAWDQEEVSLHSFHVLLKQAIEAISFVLLLSDYKISDIIVRCDPQLQQTLASLTYERLLTTTEGRDVAKRLVTALIEQQIGQELGIDTLSEILQQRCGTFCQPGDVVMYKAEESMRRAEGSRDPIERSDNLTESLRLFSKAAGSISGSRLKEVSSRYRNLQYTPGSVELPLRCAAQIDPNERAVDYYNDGQHPSDPRKVLYTSRMECYSCVIETLAMYDDLLDRATSSGGNASSAGQKRDEAYSLAIASDDELFHYYLYDWHVSRNLQEQLLEFDTPYIEQYLRRTTSSVEGQRDLLWKFYARREEYLAASKALNDLATRPSPMSLHERTYYLAQSLTSAKSAASLGTEDVEFTSRLQERIDVAQVQMEVARAVELHHEMNQDEKEQALGQLTGDLLGLDELYQNFARPLRLYEPILLILKTADTRIEEVCEAVWKQLLQSQLGMDQPASGMGDMVVDLCRKYYPSEAAPLDIILPVVYREAVQLRGSSGWATSSLIEGGVGIRDCWDMVISLDDLADSEAEREFFAEEATVVVERWVDDRGSIPAAEVERYASAYLLRTSGANDERRMATREKMQKGKQAVRW